MATQADTRKDRRNSEYIQRFLLECKRQHLIIGWEEKYSSSTEDFRKFFLLKFTNRYGRTATIKLNGKKGENESDHAVYIIFPKHCVSPHNGHHFPTEAFTQLKKIRDDSLVGFNHEEKVISLLRKLKLRQNFLFPDMPELNGKIRRISYVEHSGKGRDDGGIDIDVGVITVSGEQRIVPIQVKSSTERQRQHRNKHPSIPSIVIHGFETDKEIEISLLKILIFFLAGQVLHL